MTQYQCPVCDKCWAVEDDNIYKHEPILMACSESCEDEQNEDNVKSTGELLDEFISQNKFYHFEGDTGVERLEKVCAALGDYGHGFRFGSPLEHFLSDNPGAMEAILDWIREQDFDEWNESIISHLEPESCEDDK